MIWTEYYYELSSIATIKQWSRRTLQRFTHYSAFSFYNVEPKRKMQYFFATLRNVAPLRE